MIGPGLVTFLAPFSLCRPRCEVIWEGVGGGDDAEEGVSGPNSCPTWPLAAEAVGRLSEQSISGTFLLDNVRVFFTYL